MVFAYKATVVKIPNLSVPWPGHEDAYNPESLVEATVDRVSRLSRPATHPSHGSGCMARKRPILGRKSRGSRSQYRDFYVRTLTALFYARIGHTTDKLDNVSGPLGGVVIETTGEIEIGIENKSRMQIITGIHRSSPKPRIFLVSENFSDSMSVSDIEVIC